MRGAKSESEIASEREKGVSETERKPGASMGEKRGRAAGAGARGGGARCRCLQAFLSQQFRLERGQRVDSVGQPAVPHAASPFPPPQNTRPPQPTPKPQHEVRCASIRACLHACMRAGCPKASHAQSQCRIKMHGAANPCERAPKTPKSLVPNTPLTHKPTLGLWVKTSPLSLVAPHTPDASLDCLDCGQVGRFQPKAPRHTHHKQHTTHTFTHTQTAHTDSIGSCLPVRPAIANKPPG